MNYDELCFTFADSFIADMPAVPEASFADLVSCDLQSDHSEFSSFRQQYSLQMKQLDQVVMALQNQLTHAMVTNAGLLNELKRRTLDTNTRLMNMQALHERKMHRQQGIANMLTERLALSEKTADESKSCIMLLQDENSKLKAAQTIHARELENYASLLQKAKEDMAVQIEAAESRGRRSVTQEFSKRSQHQPELSQSHLEQEYEEEVSGNLISRSPSHKKKTLGSELQGLISKINAHLQDSKVMHSSVSLADSLDVLKEKLMLLEGSKLT